MAADDFVIPYDFSDYMYEDSDWGDLLTSFHSCEVTYDSIGNPLVYYNSTTFTWSGRQLESATRSGKTYYFTYNDEGIRTTKKVNGVTTTYYLAGSRIIGEETNGNVILYIYDESGVIGMQYHGYSDRQDAWETYWFEKNLHGDIIAVYDYLGNKLIAYEYNSFGFCYNPTYVTSSASSSPAAKNPFRYRGYYYDSDLGLYYLNSRYYDPYIGRFISPDSVGYLGANGDLQSYNLYAYCGNNPVMYVDPTGNFPVLALVLGITALAGLGLTIGGVAADNNTLTAIGLTMVAIPALISGGMAIAAGIGGATLTGIVGGATILAGVGTGLFASAEYQQAFTGNNWILDTGISEGVYNGLMLATAAVATAGTFASSFARAFNIKSIQQFGSFGKYGQEGYRGMRFTTRTGKTRVLSFHSHSHVVGKNISQWHWQLQKWNPKAMEVAGTVGQWIWWNLRRI